MEFCSSPASQHGSWPVLAAGIRPTSFLIFISNHYLCQPVITANSSPQLCWSAEVMAISISEQGLNPWSHQGTQVWRPETNTTRNQPKNSAYASFATLSHSQRSRLLHLGTEQCQPGDLTLLSSFLCTTSSQKCHKAWSMHKQNSSQIPNPYLINTDLNTNKLMQWHTDFCWPHAEPTSSKSL